jgi:hypothetical protein
MILGMTHGEFALVVFVFALVYCALLVQKLGAYLGRALAGRPKPPPAPHA